MSFIKNNPALFYSFVIGLVGAVVAVLIALGVNVTEELKAAILGLVTMVASILIGVFTRGAVVPFQNVLEYRAIHPDGSTSHDVVLAGPANDLAVEGHEVRQLNVPDTEPDRERY